MAQKKTENTEQGQKPPVLLSVADKIAFQRNPWRVKLYDMADASAIKAVSAGTASPEQQQRAMQYIRYVLCGEDDLAFRPGDDGRRETDFAEGARFVAIQIKRLIHGNMDELMDWVRKKVQ